MPWHEIWYTHTIYCCAHELQGPEIYRTCVWGAETAEEVKPRTEPKGNNEGSWSVDGMWLRSIIFANKQMMTYCTISLESSRLLLASHVLCCPVLSSTSVLRGSKTSNIMGDKSSPCSCWRPCFQRHPKLELGVWAFKLWAPRDAAPTHRQHSFIPSSPNFIPLHFNRVVCACMSFMLLLGVSADK